MSFNWKSGKPVTFKFIFTTNIAESKLEIKKAIVEELYNLFSPKIHRISRDLELRIKKMYRSSIERSDTYKSLMGSGSRSLMGHFGFDDDGKKVNEIVDTWINGISVDFSGRKSTTDLNLNMKIHTIDKTFADVLSLDAAYQDTGKSMKVALLRAPSKYTLLLPWLRWLLLAGDKQIILESQYTIHFEEGKGRSGQALMVKSKTKKWGIPPEHAGILRNNWITKIMDELEPKINEIVEKKITDIVS